MNLVVQVPEQAIWSPPMRFLVYLYLKKKKKVDNSEFIISLLDWWRPAFDSNIPNFFSFFFKLYGKLGEINHVK